MIPDIVELFKLAILIESHPGIYSMSDVKLKRRERNLKEDYKDPCMKQVLSKM